MSHSVSCAMCGREVDDSDTVELPNGTVCVNPCYEWLDRMIEESEEIEIELEFDDEEEFG